jgi:hypothetical protein
MRISSAFPSEYLKAADLQGRSVRVVMDRVEMKDIGGDHKPILFFQGKEKGMVLNKTNANNIAVVYGDDTEDWSGREIVLFEAMVDFQGKTVAAIRVRAPQAKDRRPDDRITTGPQPRSDDIGPPMSNGPRASQRDQLEDEIPF